MNAVIIYDEFESAVRAHTMLARAAQQAKETASWSAKLWRVDVLKLSAAADLALTEAVEAHLILLAVSQVHSLLDWLEQWATRRQIPEAALAVWDGGSASTRPTRVTPELSQFAKRHGVSLIFHEKALLENKSSMVGSDFQKQAVSLTTRHQHVLEQPWRDNHQDYGINE